MELSRLTVGPDGLRDDRTISEITREITTPSSIQDRSAPEEVCDSDARARVVADKVMDLIEQEYPYDPDGDNTAAGIVMHKAFIDVMGRALANKPELVQVFSISSTLTVLDLHLKGLLTALLARESA